MEELTKTQTILLTLFVSFVTSIATGITTVTLMDQAPPAITQTLNRVVERTVEKVIQPASVVTKEIKVVVKEEDAIVAAFERNRSSVVRVETAPYDGEETGKVLGLGVIVSADGIVAIDKNLVVPDGFYRIGINGEVLGARAVFSSDTHPLAYLFLESLETKASDTLGTTKDNALFDTVKRAVGIQAKNSFQSVSFGASQKVKPGQTAITIGGVYGDTLMTGIISRVAYNAAPVATTTDDGLKEESGTAEHDRRLSAIYTDISLAAYDMSAPLLNVDGNVVGIFVLQKQGGYAVPSDIIKEELARISLRQDAQAKDVDAN
ncbi:MAG: hypothetical protein COW88_01025 [Candidatus Lloydbacteria bacterium CG22_combo_CG10-13_8_21_14_all_47_15]|uniref:Serine protease n=1 Tax=Candidatus Lloydbacteria bacterium CG22_combo_CG10-13_8_21_14_all_47_15 TaxID=1974635 RepID=A0A2H0CWF1_9BACT|nr:MAG: hypothetical protein COW88_01025 [Candidatus Lloydbacteria bacterium CG22_combo_CG10-13_8_21_14_all_47_15]